MPLMKGGELIARTLVQERVPYVFGICGHGNVGILDALYDVRDKLKFIWLENIDDALAAGFDPPPARAARKSQGGAILAA